MELEFEATVIIFLWIYYWNNFSTWLTSIVKSPSLKCPNLKVSPILFELSHCSTLENDAGFGSPDEYMIQFAPDPSENGSVEEKGDSASEYSDVDDTGLSNLIEELDPNIKEVIIYFD